MLYRVQTHRNIASAIISVGLVDEYMMDSLVKPA